MTSKVKELESTWGTEFVDAGSARAVIAMINNRGIHWYEEGLVEIRRYESKENPDRFLLNKIPARSLVADFLQISTGHHEGVVRRTVAFCYDPKNGFGQLK